MNVILNIEDINPHVLSRLVSVSKHTRTHGSLGCNTNASHISQVLSLSPKPKMGKLVVA